MDTDTVREQDTVSQHMSDQFKVIPPIYQRKTGWFYISVEDEMTRLPPEQLHRILQLRQAALGSGHGQLRCTHGGIPQQEGHDQDKKTKPQVGRNGHQ